MGPLLGKHKRLVPDETIYETVRCLKTVVPVFFVLCTFVALWIVLWATDGLPSRNVGVLAGTHRCALMPWMASRQSANLFRLLECGLVSVSWWSSKQAQRGFIALLLYAFRFPCLTTILDSRSLKCENTCKSETDGVKVLMGFEQDTAGGAEAQPERPGHVPVLPSEAEVEHKDWSEWSL